MRRAPPVGVTCSGGLRWRAVQVALAAVAAAAFTAWILQHAQLPAWPAALAAAVAGALAWWRARPRPVRLQWDGTQWTLDAVAGRVDVMLDPGVLMLLRWRPEGGRARWVAVGPDEAGPSWPALRAALYSPAVSSTPDTTLPE